MGQNGAWLALLRGLFQAQASRAAAPQILDVRLADAQGKAVQTIIPLAGAIFQFVAEGKHILSTSVALRKQVNEGHAGRAGMPALRKAAGRRFHVHPLTIWRNVAARRSAMASREWRACT